jgi:hypothetical protein
MNSLLHFYKYQEVVNIFWDTQTRHIFCLHIYTDLYKHCISVFAEISAMPFCLWKGWISEVTEIEIKNTNIEDSQFQLIKTQLGYTFCQITVSS